MRLFKLPAVKIFGAFLAGVLVVIAVAFAGNWPGLPHLSWAEDNGVVQAAPLPGLGPDVIPNMVAGAGPAVVRINTTTISNVSQSNPFLNDPFFRQFFGNQYSIPTQPQESHGLGSGFIVSPDGYILTNEHVISGVSEIEVTLSSREKPYPARKVGADSELDLAVLKIDAEEELPYVTLGDSDSVRVGDWVVAIGNPYGLDHTVTVGVISAKGRPMTIEDKQYRNLLQTDASINPGNSGGPLLNLKGEVVGINTAINAEAQGIGFAIPSSTVKAVFEDLVNKGSVDHPYIGVYLQAVTKEAAKYFGLSDLNGAIVASVVRGGPAYTAGLRQGDVIIGYNGNGVTNPNQLIELVQGTAIGSQVEIKFIRGGVENSVVVTIEAKKS
ncbi:S1C family serine protease [Pelotomaculum propionicicum]|uniref:Putative serine protease HhoA n=1 Tax=Pelotomaculum propionicicum TaxID=258475 RepID=A0A4Y7RSD9_9FIRM|nr:trypsin-like peptidase domain-containing protein [Pelotomaculum propionicicum]TEB11676.1 putative serine protease HhoA [Pelotomaculum propionicicum]